MTIYLEPGDEIEREVELDELGPLMCKDPRLLDVYRYNRFLRQCAVEAVAQLLNEGYVNGLYLTTSGSIVWDSDIPGPVLQLKLNQEIIHQKTKQSTVN